VETQVGIIGAGPAGLVLSHLLHLSGIESIVLEDRSREYVEKRVRAGVLEQNTVELLHQMGVGERLAREGLIHRGILLSRQGRRHRVALSDLTGGRSITIYGQQEVVKDLVAARLQTGGTIHFDVSQVELFGLDSGMPVLRYRKDGATQHLRCDFVAGCDGSHGIARPSIPEGVVRVFEREYPFAWLGILAAVAPSTEELIYARHERGFALHSLRSPEVSRLYIQVDPNCDLSEWPDDRVWEELSIRLASVDGFVLKDGPVLEKGLAVHRSVVVQPMQYGRLFLAGDAAHIVPPTGAKGLNLAVADVRALAQGIVRFYEKGDSSLLDCYTERCLGRVWRVQQFSSYMTRLFHNMPDPDGFEEHLAHAELAWVCQSEAASRSLAENYVGLPFDSA